MSIAARALHGINVCVIPSPYNNDRPLMLRHKPLATISATLIAIKALAILTIAVTPTPAQLSTITTARIIQFTNAERVAVGLDPLETNSALSAAAQEKGNHMLAEDYFAHISPAGVTPWFWITKHGYDYLVAGENLAIDFAEAEDVVAAWMASPSHKANIIHSEYTETGVAVVTGEFQGGTSTIVVHMFGKPAQVSANQPVVDPTPTPVPTTAGTAQTLSTPTPSPQVSPSTTPTPSPPPLPAPRIALIGSTAIQRSVLLEIAGTPGTTVSVLVNGEAVASTQLFSNTGKIELDVSHLEDGELVLSAYATDASTDTQTSELSNTVTVQKDTTGPEIAGEELAFIIAPAFDNTKAAVSVPHATGKRIALLDIAAGQTLEVLDELGNKTILENINLAPQFDATLTSQELVAPQRMAQLSRRIAATVSVILLVLLGLAIVIRVRIQHPALITHASLVALLAAALFLI